MARQSLMESEWKVIRPVGDNVFIIKDEDESVSEGGIIIPDAHQVYKRRGWVLAVGGGLRKPDGSIEAMPYAVGDYLVADRPFIRPNEREDEVWHNPTVLILKGDEVVGFIRRDACGGRYKLPVKFMPIIEKFGYSPGKETAVGSGAEG